jgi:uncharacterized membrane protein HdeD (DUF308 family)
MAQTGRFNLGSGGSIVWAIVLIVFGFLAIELPLASSIGVVILVAWLKIFSGGFHFIYAFQLKGIGHILWKLLVEILYLIVGIDFLLNPLIGVASFTLGTGLFLSDRGNSRLRRLFRKSQRPTIGLDCVG